MLKSIKSLWRGLGNIGLREEMQGIQRAKNRIFNYLVFSILLIQLCLLVREVITQDLIGLILISSFCIISISFLLFNRFLGLDKAAGIFNIFFPLIMGLYLTMVGKGEGIEYSFFVFMLTAIIFQRNRNFQIFLIIYNISIFLSGIYWIDTHGVLLKEREGEQSDYTVLFVAASICFAVVIYVFTRALEQYDHKSADLITSLQQKNEKLATINEELERFTYIASHDLKTPLRNIVSFLGLMERRLKEQKNEEVEEYFSIVQDNARGMYRIIEETLEYSKIGQNEWKKEAVDLDLILDKIKDQLLNPEERHCIESANLPVLTGDSFYIYKLFFNLIENGFKYNTKVAKKVCVEAEIKKDTILVRIKDNGIGIEPKYFDQIFEMYKRLHTLEEYQGTGIGLSMCKKIVQAMDGKIWLESTPQKGSTFFLEFPQT